jgi:hypothetical protein
VLSCALTGTDTASGGCYVSDVGELVKTFKALRVDGGLTANKLEGPAGRALLDLLTSTGSGEAGLQVLDQLIGRMLDPSKAWVMRDVGDKVKKHLIPRAVRVALALGKDDQGNSLSGRGILKKRRDWACGEGLPDSKAPFYFMKADIRTHIRYEEDGFRALARLVIANIKNPAFQESADSQLPRADQPEPSDAVQHQYAKEDEDAFDKAAKQPRDIDRNETDSASITLTAPDDLSLLDQLSAPSTEDLTKGLPTFRDALSTLRDAFTRLEFTYMPDRFRYEPKSGEGKNLAFGFFAGFMLSLVVTLVILGATGIISK